jgi:hypothetical protein
MSRRASLPYDQACLNDFRARVRGETREMFGRFLSAVIALGNSQGRRPVMEGEGLERPTWGRCLGGIRYRPVGGSREHPLDKGIPACSGRVMRRGMMRKGDVARRPSPSLQVRGGKACAGLIGKIDVFG